jgi:membrane-associated phospholipid phosphatase
LSDVPVTGFFSKAVKIVQEFGEHPTGAFPSSHVGMALIFLWISRKSSKVMFWILVPFVIVILFATVYIKAHYAVDIIGGILSAPLILFFSIKLWQILSI